MTDETIVAIFETTPQADAAVTGLHAANIPADAISQHASPSAVADGPAATPGPARDPGFWSGLLGGEPDHGTAVYDHGILGGGTVVAVKAPAAHVTQILAILEQHNPVDIDEQVVGSGQPAQQGPGTGKRLVNRGSSRIRRYVVEATD